MAKPRPTIIFQDDDVVIVNKPANWLSIPDRYDPTKPNLYHWLQQQYENIFIIHRLDRETSGVICFAKNEAAHKHLNQQFADRTTKKIYQVLIEGTPANDSGIIDKAIAKSMTHPGRMVIADRGKPSVTTWEVAERFKNYTLLNASIHTGRTHQIRVHFQSTGYPLAVDKLYGRKEEFLLSQVKLRNFRMGKEQEERPLLTRTSLHAYQLTIQHPSTEEQLTFSAELPRDFAAVVKQLRKWGK
ncbi:MAG: RluA family pseudouridine synthase [Saprospiraceae bacterium]